MAVICVYIKCYSCETAVNYEDEWQIFALNKKIEILPFPVKEAKSWPPLEGG